jgi:iron(III) transport system ATP-binding protein
MIDVVGLWKHYTDAGAPIPAVRGVTFTVPKGQFYSLVGPSGCGKTTTLRSIAGLETPQRGTVRIGEKTVFSVADRTNMPPFRRGIGMVFQNYAIWPHLSVYENVVFPLTTRKRRVSQPELKERVESCLELVGLAGFSSRPATSLSGGQQQRLALSRALVAEPDVLLLDEPLSNLDAKLREQMRIELRDLQRRLGITTLYVTHDQAEALSMSDRIAVMHNGEIEQEGTPEEIYTVPANEFVATFMGTTNLIRGTWRAGPPARLVFPGGELVCRPLDVRDGSSGCVSVRPESIDVAGDAAAGSVNVFPGVIVSTMFVGQYTDCRIRLGGQVTLRVFTRPSKRLNPGQSLILRIVPEVCTVITPASSATEKPAAEPLREGPQGIS